MGYSLDRRSAVLKRMLPPNNVAIRQLSQEEGISEATRCTKGVRTHVVRASSCLMLMRALRAGLHVTSSRRCWKLLR
jgi:hypothetical protein